MAGFNAEQIEDFLRARLGEGLKVRDLCVLGEPHGADLKGYGYGKPVLIDYVCQGMPGRLVLHTVKPGHFGHEHMADRAQALLWDHDAFNRLPRHVRSVDVGAIRRSGSAVSLADADEFFLLTEYAEGTPYSDDLVRMQRELVLSPADCVRADALCDYLVGIHRVVGDDPELYIRRIRELVGHSECIMGLIDSYPVRGPVTPEILRWIENRCVEWRWRLKNRTGRLRQVHGDFHPWNILFGRGPEFSVLDRSRGEWGDPADDVTCLTMNYVFFSLQRSERLDGNFESLFLRFWDRYLSKSGDTEMLQVTAPFFAFRGLVMAHPGWYPDLSDTVRGKLLNFVRAVLEENVFRPEDVRRYCEA